MQKREHVANSTKQDQSGLAGAGKYLAVASELPCTVVAMLFAGQILGSSLWGAQGGIWGAIIGVIGGFVLGAYGVYVTIRYFDRTERDIMLRRKYAPSPEEIAEDVVFPLDEQDSEDAS
jgi:hypothetical protein